MPDSLKRAGLVLGLALLGACHTDPFSIKPEVNVTLPEKPAEPAPDEVPDGEAGGSQTP